MRDLTEKQAKLELGHALNLIQHGLQPENTKPMFDAIGPGTYEVTVKTPNEHRLFYVAKFPEGVYALHVFNKKTRKTSPRDIDTGKARYKAMIAYRSKLPHD